MDMSDTGVNRRKFLYGTATAGIIGLAGCSGNGDGGDGGDDGGDGGDDGGDGGDGGDESLELRIGTSTGGTQDVGLAVERAVSEESDTLEYSTVESPGYIGTLYRLDQDQFDGGITDNNSMNKALDGEDDFEEQPVENIPLQGFGAFPYSIYLVARDGTGIETFDDLAGKNVYPAEPGFSTRGTTLDVFAQEPTADIYEEMNIRDMGVDDAPGAMEEERIDAAIAYGTAGVRYTGWVTEMASRIDLHYVEPTEELIESAESFAGAGSSTTPYDDWPLADQDIGTDEIFTWNLEVNYVFHADANPDAVYELCRVVHEHNDTVNEGEEQFNDFESAEDMLGQVMESEDFPVHPGAAQYYKDNDVWDSGDYYEP